MAMVDEGTALSDGRREARRLARRRALLAAAMEIVSSEGARHLTIQGVADKVGCSVGTVYTHFPSKDALISELQDVAVQQITRSYELMQSKSEEILEASNASERERAVAALVCLGDQFRASWDNLPEESHLVFSVLSERREIVTPAEQARVLSSAVVLMQLGGSVIRQAGKLGIINRASTIERVIMLSASLLGVLLTSHLQHLDPEHFDHKKLVLATWETLLKGWGMSDSDFQSGRHHAAVMERAGAFAPVPN